MLFFIKAEKQKNCCQRKSHVLSQYTMLKNSHQATYDFPTQWTILFNSCNGSYELVHITQHYPTALAQFEHFTSKTRVRFQKGGFRSPSPPGCATSQTDAYFSRPTALISLLYLFRQCAYFSTALISLPRFFQCNKFFQRVPKTWTIYRAIKQTFGNCVDTILFGFDWSTEKHDIKMIAKVPKLIFCCFCLKV